MISADSKLILCAHIPMKIKIYKLKKTFQWNRFFIADQISVIIIYQGKTSIKSTCFIFFHDASINMYLRFIWFLYLFLQIIHYLSSASLTISLMQKILTVILFGAITWSYDKFLFCKETESIPYLDIFKHTFPFITM